MLSKLPAAKRDAVIAALFGPKTGCGLNLCRVPIGANDHALDWYSCKPAPTNTQAIYAAVQRCRVSVISADWVPTSSHVRG